MFIGDSDTKEDIDNLVNALKKMQKRESGRRCSMNKIYSIVPPRSIIPRHAFFAPKESIELKKSVNYISGETIMCCPPEIPMITMGEIITREVIDSINEARNNGCILAGAKDPTLNKIQIVKVK